MNPRALIKNVKSLVQKPKKALKPSLSKTLFAIQGPVQLSLSRNNVASQKRLLSVQKFQGNQKKTDWKKSHHLIAQIKKATTQSYARMSFKHGPEAAKYLNQNGLNKLKNGTVAQIRVANKHTMVKSHSFAKPLSLPKLHEQQKRSFGLSSLTKFVPTQRNLFSNNIPRPLPVVPQKMAFISKTTTSRTNIEMRKLTTSAGEMRATATITHHDPKTKIFGFKSQKSRFGGFITRTPLVSPVHPAISALTRPALISRGFCSDVPKLEGSQTHQNLCDAFAGESCANRRYLFFAQKADIEGHPEVASLFRATAEGETGHAHGHLYFLEEVGDPATSLPIGNSVSNLKSAVAGETHEYTDMYPAMAKTAREEGFDEIADWFETLAMAEKSHAGKFQRALENLEKELN